eukprot:323602-Pyramimonas_sp.AAC.1
MTAARTPPSISLMRPVAPRGRWTLRLQFKWPRVCGSKTTRRALALPSSFYIVPRASSPNTR